jgi:hypothetical protein
MNENYRDCSLAIRKSWLTGINETESEQVGEVMCMDES